MAPMGITAGMRTTVSDCERAPAEWLSSVLGALAHFYSGIICIDSACQ
jgi:hypothetical protein